MILATLRAGFADPPRAAAPMMRWWWFGPKTERAEIDRQLTAMAAAGLGGAEVAYVYPLGAALEPTETPFLSEPFLADLRFAAERARDLGLRFDLTLGSGWSFGGPHVDAGLAARKLSWERREIVPGPLMIPVVDRWPGDELVAAFVGAGSLQEPPEAVEPLPIEGGVVRVPDGTGTRVVILAWSQLTGQNVKRAALGAEGPVLDHYAAAAVDAHLRAVGDRLLDAVPAELLGSVFCDSLEAYEADWTPALPAEFERRRGYDVLPVLAALTLDLPDAQRARADVHRTLVELYEENFVARIQRWAAARGVPFRIQGYGSPPATLSSYRHADLFEGEGFGWRKLTPSRWAASAAHRYDRRVASAEVWTWVHSPSFRATPLDLAAEAHDHLLNGINLFVGHGWPYSPAAAPGIGWAFYAAGALDDRNPWWPAAPGLFAYLQRMCWLLQQGEPVADIALYVPTEDLLATMGTAVGGSLDTWREASRRLPEQVTGAIRSAGFDYDLIDDPAIVGLSPSRYPVVVVPPGAFVPAATQAWLARCATVIAYADAVDLAARLATALAPDLRVEPARDDVGFVHRRLPDAEVYFVANTGPERRTCTITPRDLRAHAERWDARDGTVRWSGSAEPAITLDLQPYEAAVLVLSDSPAPFDKLRETDGELRETDGELRETDGELRETGGGLKETDGELTETDAELRETDGELSLVLDEGWDVTFPDQAARPVALPHRWEDEPDRVHYSGAARYRCSVQLEALEPSTTVTLDLGACSSRPARTGADGMVGASFRAEVAGPVGEIAVVEVNGIRCGVAWAPPYVVDVSAAVHPGPNTIELIVANTAANALAADTELAELARQSEAAYGRRARMQDLTRAGATVASGLLAAPTLVIAEVAP